MIWSNNLQLTFFENNNLGISKQRSGPDIVIDN